MTRPAGQNGREDLARTAREVFGWRELRPGQTAAMEHVLAGRDTLVVMPTGAGKSAVYQVPALLLPGPTVVVSPLLALQRDQIAGLPAHRAAPAVAVNSAQSAEQSEAAWEAVRGGDAAYLFLAPEQLAKDEVVDALASARPALFVVDEAQCVAAWGHDFRPDYLRLGQAARRVGRPPVLALTATAAPPVRREIAERLGMDDPALVVAGFDRPEISLEVSRFTDDGDKRRAVVERAAAERKPGIVYTATRKDSEAYAGELAELGLAAAAYHAGLRAAERSRVHDAFLDGRLDVVVATSAFGMGIDKEDVRFVLHASVPGSLDAYYQEIGRAGRDGQPAAAVLHYRPEDTGMQNFLATRTPHEDTLAEVAGQLGEQPGSVDDLRERTGLSRHRVTAAANLLEESGAARTDDDGTLRAAGDADPDEAAERARETAADRRRLERSRVEMVRAYAETTGCRRRFLLGYFGESYQPPCGACDVCRSGTQDAADGRARQAEDGGRYGPGARVRHTEWGDGAVLSGEGDRITVLFETVGYRTLSLDAVERGGLLTLLEAPAA
ncbi:RecQ family ATP-dependent DNA helicase [Streptomyces sp. ODS05-4]|uniref:RecQ family ATP-dependent DNA helicase n=1 Tax=Streptomyces sp. ODS05-4 TaxID=2944939 RepID=UPI00210D4FD2|nr:RecQ family ATP-dependent DNA helicase [Streptomyces sp. ODS05-4]